MVKISSSGTTLKSSLTVFHDLSMIIFKSVSNLESPKISNSLKLIIYDHPYGHNM